MNPELEMTLDDAVMEVLGTLYGDDMQYRPELMTYRAVTRQINAALRQVATEKEWSYYSSVTNVGQAIAGQRLVPIRSSLRPRIINDDAVRLVDPKTNLPMSWAYFLPRDALHKYAHRNGLWVAHTKQNLEFSRPFSRSEHCLEIHLPVMREPVMFRLPRQSEDPNAPLITVDEEVREQLVDFPHPDLVLRCAAFFYAQFDPVLQPRVQTLEERYKDLMYQLSERDEKNTDTPYQNEWNLGIEGSIDGNGFGYNHGHPHADGSMF